MNHRKLVIALVLPLLFQQCSLPQFTQVATDTRQPAFYATTADSTNSARLEWSRFFTDPYLIALIDTALGRNQELRILTQEVAISNNEVRARKGEYLPFVGIGVGGSAEKPGRYTTQGATEANLDIKKDKEFPDPLTNVGGGLYASWEVDIWKKLRRSRKAAYYRYLGSIEGRNFAVTRLIAEIANSYYELMALDNQLEILKQNIDIQTNALEIVRLQKAAAKVTELAVKRFEAEVLKNRSLQYDIQQQIVEMENRINYLLGRYPQSIARNSNNFQKLTPQVVLAGLPAQLLENRPDIRQAMRDLEAAKLNVQVAKASFYPSLTLRAGLGYEAFNPAYLLQTPESILYSVAGELMAPLVNRNAIKANYSSANARQVQAVYHYDQTLVRAHVEVVNQLSNISNLERARALRQDQVEALTQSISVATLLFQSARADYMEVLLTQRDALESRFDLVETQKQQLNAVVNLYQALGGGWR